MRSSGRNRALLLASAVLVAVIFVACGRASEDDINAALGITPTATLSAEQVAQATEDAITRATEIANSGNGTPSDALNNTNLAALGSVQLGRTNFATQCQRCHTPNGAGAAAALVGSTSPSTNLNDVQIYDMLKNGTNHDKAEGGPGPLNLLTDDQIYNIIAYIRDQEKK